MKKIQSTKNKDGVSPDITKIDIRNLRILKKYRKVEEIINELCKLFYQQIDIRQTIEFLYEKLEEPPCYFILSVKDKDLYCCDFEDVVETILKNIKHTKEQKEHAYKIIDGYDWWYFIKH